MEGSVLKSTKAHYHTTPAGVRRPPHFGDGFLFVNYSNLTPILNKDNDCMLMKDVTKIATTY